ncbi:DUF2000 domain-containing protein [Caballeronia sp. LZ062]|uniref:DUF2000 domain-containing protein n=1 Tax=unclassified Caballeronia TaxID=2646786 RepID=UPI00285ACC69|nr:MULTISPECIES: DUF2000 domain-containing protein [unclassified Caballeronia]MDR5856290.1 DUF2000 domain-containing protein [Caballeronia sp. LZ050]MDR5872960.1 DUF2000 domain-containing protein [Caballeronia sp. LZ062]
MTNETTQAGARAQRCVIVVDRALPAGKAANAAAVLALTVGQRHPALVGEPLVDASGVAHPGLIPVGIAVLAATQDELASIRGKALAADCDVVAFPEQGQQTTDYAAFRDAVATVATDALRYVGVALIGDRKPVSKAVANLGLLK